MATNASTHTNRGFFVRYFILLLGLTPMSHGFVEVYRGALTLDLNARVIYDDNVGGNALGVSDTLFSFRPTLNYRRDVGRSNIRAALGYDFSRYQDFDSFDFNDYNASLSVDVPVAAGSKYSGTFGISRNQDSGSDQSLLRRVQTVNTRLNFDSVYTVGARTGLRLGLGYNKREPEGFSSTTNNDIRVGVQYQLRSVNALFLDYRYRTTESDGGVDNVSNGIFFGLSRPLGGKVSGSVSVGYENTTVKGIAVDDETRWLLNANISWNPREFTRFNLRVSQDLYADTLNQSVDRSSVELSMNQDLGQRFTLDLRAAYNWYDFQGGAGRKDEVLDLTARLNYSFNSRLTAMTEYQFTDSSSDVSLAGYSRNRVSLSVSYEF